MDENRPSLLSTSLDCGDLRPRDRRNKRVFARLLLAWGLSYIAAAYLGKTERVPAGVAQWVAVAVPVVMAVLAVLAYARYLLRTDELDRSIELHAIVAAFGAGFVVWQVCEMVEVFGASLGGWSSAPILAMCIAYSAGVLVGRRRYQ